MILFGRKSRGLMPPVRRVVITGASGGIGAATARHFAVQGAAIWITYARSQEKTNQVAEDCVAAGASEVHVSHLDLRDPESIESLIAAISDEWGSLDALINNGSVCHYVAMEDISLDLWDETLETNARGTFLISRAALKLLRVSVANGRDASIVNVSSIAGQIGGVTTSFAYAASKGATLALTRSFARQLAAEKIRVNAVAPGPIDTPITGHLSEQERTALASKVPLGRFGTPEEVAEMCMFLASPSSGFTTGATFDVNGGLLMA
jgi:3-oxoacyl-[acyl-carrier protein] reductase